MSNSLIPEPLLSEMKRLGFHRPMSSVGLRVLVAGEFVKHPDKKYDGHYPVSYRDGVWYVNTAEVPSPATVEQLHEIMRQAGITPQC